MEMSCTRAMRMCRSRFRGSKCWKINAGFACSWAELSWSMLSWSKAAPVSTYVCRWWLGTNFCLLFSHYLRYDYLFFGCWCYFHEEKWTTEHGTKWLTKTTDILKCWCVSCCNYVTFFFTFTFPRHFLNNLFFHSTRAIQRILHYLPTRQGRRKHFWK